MNKRGLQLSFGIIFSVIIIISIISVSFYAIGKFLGVKKCTEQALFYEDLQKRVDRAWNSEIVKDVFTGRVSNGIDKVCFGDLSQQGDGLEYDALRSYRAAEGNVFMYPPAKACEGFVTQNIKHLGFDFTSIRCFDVENGRVTIPIEKDSTDALVRVPIS